jgi:hypothetical protein
MDRYVTTPSAEINLTIMRFAGVIAGAGAFR